MRKLQLSAPCDQRIRKSNVWTSSYLFSPLFYPPSPVGFLPNFFLLHSFKTVKPVFFSLPLHFCRQLNIRVPTYVYRISHFGRYNCTYDINDVFLPTCCFHPLSSTTFFCSIFWFFSFHLPKHDNMRLLNYQRARC